MMKSLRNTRLGIYLQNSKIGPLLEIILVFGITIIFILSVTKLAGSSQFLSQILLWLANLLLIFLVAISQWSRGAKLADLGLWWSQTKWRDYLILTGRSFLILLAGLLAFILGAVLMAQLGLEETRTAANYDYLKENPAIFLVSLLGVYVVSSFGEELVYRGFLMQRLLALFGPGTMSKVCVVLISAIVFGLVHYQWGPIGMVQTALMGVVFGGSYLILKQNLIALILAHAYMDTLLFLSIYFN